MTTFTFAVPPEVHALDLIGPSHVFYEAQEIGAEMNLIHFSITNQDKVIASNGLAFADLVPFSDLELTSEDWIFVPGLPMPTMQSEQFIADTQAFIVWLKEQSDKGVNIVSVCTGTFLLGRSGILDFKTCTTHWKFIPSLQKQFPKTKVLQNRIFVENGNLYASAGVTSGIDLALNILEKVYGPQLALDTMLMAVVYLRRGKEDKQVSVYLQHRNHLEDRIHKVQSWINKNVKSDFNIEQLAALIHVSPRHLTRLFKKTTGVTIGQYIEEIKLETAVQLLKHNHKLEFIAHECGFSDPQQLRRLFKKYFNKLPSEL